jgi:pimeloyl-ACP methyl ester carboxylesterase
VAGGAAPPGRSGADDDSDACSTSTSTSTSSSSSLSSGNDGASASVSSGGASYWASRGGAAAAPGGSAGTDGGGEASGKAAPGWPVEREDHECTTSDGVTLRLVRGACPDAAAALPPREHPIILVPGLASSAAATWDVAPRLSLFEHLARQGYDVWLVDLRGERSLFLGG